MGQRQSAPRCETPPRPPTIRYVDRTAEKAQEAAERERQRILNLKRIEEEKNKKVVEALQPLLSYEFGNQMGEGAFRHFDISDMNRPGSIRIGLFGPAGAGKSSFIYSCERTLKQVKRGTADVKVQLGEGTIRVGDYVAGPWHFKLVDTRGFGDYGSGEVDAFRDILYGALTEGQEIDFECSQGEEEESEDITDWIHSVIFVLSATDPSLWSDDLNEYMNPFREFMRPTGFAPITVVTHKDELIKQGKGSQANEVLSKASAATGSALSHTFFMTNYIGAEDKNPDIELDVCKILEFALTMGERYVRFAKNREQKKEKTASQGIGDMSIGNDGEELSVFFERLQNEHNLSSDKVSYIQTKLESGGIRNVTTLKASWESVQERLSLSNAMKKYITRALE